MFDYHMHTTFSDGKNSIKEMIDTADNLGLKTICITDHIWQSSKWFNKYCELIKMNSINRNLNVLIGFEAKALDVSGNIDATEEMCNKADIRIGAIHRIPNGNILNEYLTREDILKNKKYAYNNWLQTTKNMIKNIDVDIIAHPCMVLKKYKLEQKEEDIYNLFILAQKYNKKMEISSRYKGVNDFLFNILKQYPSLITYTSYGSDSHSVDDLIKAHNGK